MRRHSWAAAVLVLAAAMAACGPARQAQEGDLVPDVHLEWVQGPGAPLNSLRGKVVVLEFWATWCPPCVKAIPHLDELARAFRDKPVVFISITDESRDVVGRFLRNNPISGWVACEAWQAYQSFRTYGRPTTLLVGVDGRILTATEPERLTAGLIDDALAGKLTPRHRHGTAAGAPQGPPLAQVSLSTAAVLSPFMRSRGSLVGAGMPLSAAISGVCGVPQEKVVLGPGVEDGLYGVVAKGRPEALCEAFLGVVKAALPVSVDRGTGRIELRRSFPSTPR